MKGLAWVKQSIDWVSNLGASNVRVANHLDGLEKTWVRF